MKSGTNAMVYVLVVGCVVCVAGWASAQNYAWVRSTEDLWAYSEVSATAQGETNPGTDSDFDDTGGPVACGTIVTKTQTAYGGGGGDGGDGGTGDSVSAHEAGLFQGVIEVWADN